MSGTTLRIEFVSIHDSTTPLRASAEKIISGMHPDSNFKFEKDKIIYKGNFPVKYQYSDLFNIDGSLGVLHAFEMNCATDPTQDDCDNFSGMLKSFRTNLNSVGSTKIETLWDDVSFRYCHLSYPIILDVENKMRRLIAKFMLSKLGARWADDSAPDDISKEIERTRRNATDPLHNVDFISLSAYLTKPYAKAKKTPADINKIIGSIDAEKPDDMKEKVLQLQAMVPSSNWERYFHSVVPCQDSELQTKWQKLYELRCIVAHNAYMNAVEYKKVLELSKELQSILDVAISKIGGIVVTPEQVEDLSEMITNMAAPNIFVGGGLTSKLGVNVADPIVKNIIESSNSKINYAKSTMREIARHSGVLVHVNASFMALVSWCRSKNIIGDFDEYILQKLFDISIGNASTISRADMVGIDNAAMDIIYGKLKNQRTRMAKVESEIFKNSSPTKSRESVNDSAAQEDISTDGNE
ncbi:HEPN domain-containing protein [Burkholderia glumae]|uniref:HEPN domain-containing protein n=1 Tax=Burkholderia glumae TaxID=337 RepID=UPI0020371693|nr:HEPN domain-containing protein [Burkholderia glumae]MCM2540900.1 HEPN domain-containing protein [Burkholderia glumae]